MNHWLRYLNAATEDLSDVAIRKVAPTLILGATDAMRVMQEEMIFGPLLPVVTHRTLDDAIAYINGNTLISSLFIARPLPRAPVR